MQPYHVPGKRRTRNILWRLLVTSMYTHLLSTILTRVTSTLIFDCSISVEFLHFQVSGLNLECDDPMNVGWFEVEAGLLPWPSAHLLWQLCFLFFL